jgi:hypothetical protein
MRQKLTKSQTEAAYNLFMRRVVTMAAFGLLLAVPVWAQHGGGGHGGGGGGGHASFGGGHASSGGHSGGVSGGSHVSSFHGSPSAPAVHSFHGSPEFHNPEFSSRTGERVALSSAYRPGYSSNFVPLHSARGNFSRGPYLHDGLGGNRFGNRRCFGFPCRGFFSYPWAYGYGFYNPFWYNSFWYDPYWWWDSDSSYYGDDTTGYEQYVADAAVMNEQNLQQQNLEQENLERQQMFDQEQNDGDQDLYLPQQGMQAAPTSNAPTGSAIMPATILIFRDQHKEEVQNYAIVGQTLWSFSPQHTQRIVLADLDIAATIKANENNGVTFRVPGVNDAQ